MKNEPIAVLVGGIATLVIFRYKVTTVHAHEHHYHNTPLNEECQNHNGEWKPDADN